jgi:hypothetical protein
MYYQYFADTNPLQTIESKDFTPKIPPGAGEGGTPRRRKTKSKGPDLSEPSTQQH